MIKTWVAVLEIDLGGHSCSLAGLDASGAVITPRRMAGEGAFAFVTRLPACNGDGSLLLRALPELDAPGLDHALRADGARMCPAVREGAED